MTNRSITALALAGSCFAASAQTINIVADLTSVALGDVVTWTVSVTGLTAAQFVQAYDFNLIASFDPGFASGFNTELSNLIGATPGTPSGASVFGASGGQSSLVDPINATLGDVVLGTFTTTMDDFSVGGHLSYGVEDGGVLGAPIIRVRVGSDLGPIALEGDDFDVISDSVLVPPAPGAGVALGFGLALAHRRRRSHEIT